MSRHFIMFLGAVLLSGCGGDDNPARTEAALSIEDYNKLVPAGIGAGALKPATAEALTTHLKNGLRLNVNIGLNDRSVTAIDGVAAAEGAALSAARSSQYSATNTQVLGVDEADYVKYDGEHLFMVTAPEFVWGEPRPNAEIRILATDPDTASISELGSIALEDEQWGEVSELYLLANAQSTEALITLQSSWNYITAAEPQLGDATFAFWPAPVDNQVLINRYALTDISAPTLDFSLAIDGVLQASRQIDNTLYLVTQYSPYLPTIDYVFNSADAAQLNEQRIAELDLVDLLPHYRINDGMAHPLLQAEDCLLPADAGPWEGYHNLVALVAVDLEQQAISSSTCLNAQVDGVYTSAESLYLGGSSLLAAEAPFDSETVVHKFDLRQGVDYRATAVVPGSIGWQNPSFRMDEYQGYFRIVTSTRDRDDNFQPRHRLTILQDTPASQTMSVVAQLPNDQQPQAIGKPNEAIFAVRFIGERAYIVTFERIDPLYVLNLTEADNPQIAGELEVPGVSTYLHPVGENYLLGIGQDADPSGLLQGLKVSLFDVATLSAPREIAQYLLGAPGSWSSALYDLRALSFLSPDSDRLRFSFAASLFSQPFVWQQEALQLFEISGLDSDLANLDFVGQIVSESAEQGQLWPSHSGTARAILHDDAVFYTHGDRVWAAFWSTPAMASGPH